MDFLNLRQRAQINLGQTGAAFEEIPRYLSHMREGAYIERLKATRVVQPVLSCESLKATAQCEEPRSQLLPLRQGADIERCETRTTTEEKVPHHCNL